MFVMTVGGRASEQGSRRESRKMRVERGLPRQTGHGEAHRRIGLAGHDNVMQIHETVCKKLLACQMNALY